MKLIETISNDINVPQEMLTGALRNARKLVKHLTIPKRNGSPRYVYQPSKKLKIIQYWLINHVFQYLDIHPAATAFLKTSSIKTNVIRHKKGRYFLKLDFKNFFPSIISNDFCPIVKNWAQKTGSTIDCNELLETVRVSCFYLDDKLPIGYPSSPIISNIVMSEFDTKITSLLTNKEEYGLSKYTRYADDLTFSTNLKGACNKIKESVESIVGSLTSPKLQLNSDKTRFVSSSGGSALITGLRICYDGHITIHRKYKDKIRLLLSLYKKDKLSDIDLRSLKGHLSYIKYADGRFYTKLQNKHLETIDKISST